MAQTLTAQRFGQLLRTDLLFIINYIAGNNPAAVADKIAALNMTRPNSLKEIGASLNYLLNAGRGNDFVEALNVPLNVSELTSDQQVQLYAAAGNNSDSSTAARNLATKALLLFDQEPSGPEEAAPKRIERPEDLPDPAAAPASPEKKQTLTRVIWGGVGLVLFIIAVAVAIRVIKAS